MRIFERILIYEARTLIYGEKDRAPCIAPRAKTLGEIRFSNFRFRFKDFA